MPIPKRNHNYKNCPRSRIEIRPTALPHPHALDCDHMQPAAGLDRATPHASPHWRTADDITIKTYYYGRQSTLVVRRSSYLCSTHIFAITLTCDLDFQSRRAMVMTHKHAKNQGHFRSKDTVETNGRTRHDRSHYLSPWVKLS